MPLEPFKLTSEQKKGLIALEEDIKALEFEIARAKRAGLDVADLEKRFSDTKKLREGIIREYS